MAEDAINGRSAIQFIDVSRRFVIHHERRATFQDWFVSLIRPRGDAEEFWALRDVTFDVRKGEVLGVVGRNGAGKSTLLKLVTRILEPTGGRVIVNGRTYAMLELGAGFHPELSGRDNIYLNGSLYGVGRKQMQRKYEDIVHFAELERFVDTPVKHYSSGMFARLGFGIAVNMDPEILVIDEVLAVGDANFQQKCFQALDELKAGGTTILFVSHDSNTVRNFCDRAALIDGGHLLDVGLANEVVDHYQQLLQAGQPGFRILRVRALDGYRLPTDTVRSGEGMMVEVLIRTPDDARFDGLALQIELDQTDGRNLWSTRIALPEHLPVAHQASQRESDAPDTRAARLRIDELPVRSGSLRLIATLLADGGAHEIIDRSETLIHAAPSDNRQSGLLALNHEWEWEEPPAPESSLKAAGIRQEQVQR